MSSDWSIFYNALLIGQADQEDELGRLRGVKLHCQVSQERLEPQILQHPLYCLFASRFDG